jgi:hypothetical protein
MSAAKSMILPLKVSVLRLPVCACPVPLAAAKPFKSGTVSMSHAMTFAHVDYRLSVAASAKPFEQTR